MGTEHRKKERKKKNFIEYCLDRLYQIVNFVTSRLSVELPSPHHIFNIIQVSHSHERGEKRKKKNPVIKVHDRIFPRCFFFLHEPLQAMSIIIYYR